MNAIDLQQISVQTHKLPAYGLTNACPAIHTNAYMFVCIYTLSSANSHVARASIKIEAQAYACGCVCKLKLSDIRALMSDFVAAAAQQPAALGEYTYTVAQKKLTMQRTCSLVVFVVIGWH